MVVYVVKMVNKMRNKER